MEENYVVGYPEQTESKHDEAGNHADYIDNHETIYTAAENLGTFVYLNEIENKSEINKAVQSATAINCVEMFKNLSILEQQYPF